ncbi:hydrolase-4 domain-containing protein [Favolaschia claudopus]|uniref:Hydrolase-4 domain-containing protein n=1 Tax=Favolaschia claudopus TaxID=2862362 RepID=A0AAW0E1C7_9AGAR
MPLHALHDMSSNSYTEAWLDGPQSTKFYTRTYHASPSESKAVLVFVHGFAEHIGRYTEAHPEYASHGINVFTFDQRGFGNTALDTKNKSKSSSYGKTSAEDQLEDIQWALNHAKETFPGLPLFLGGHSMGGAETLSFSVHRDAVSILAGVVSCSPLIKQTKPASKIARGLGGLVAAPLPYMTIPTPIPFNDLSHDAEYNRMCSTDPLAKLQGTLRGVSDMFNWGDLLLSVNYKKWPKSLPVLFLHGTGDQVTSHNATKEFHDKIVADDKKLIFYDDGFHELIHEPNHRQKMLDDAIAWIHAHLPVKPVAPAASTEESTEPEAKL